MKQTLEATYDPGALKLDGPNVKFTSVSQIFSQIPGKPGGDRFSIKLTVNRDFSATQTFARNSDGVIDILEEIVKRGKSIDRSDADLFFQGFLRLIHVPGFRGNPERNYKITGISSTFPGLFENYVATIINHWQKTENQRLIELYQAMETLGLTSDV